MFGVVAYAVDTPYKDMTPDERKALPEFSDERIHLVTDIDLDLTEYQGEGPFDFYGAQIISIEKISDLTSVGINVFDYNVFWDRSAHKDALEVADILKEQEHISYMFTFSKYAVGDINSDDYVDQYDYILASRIYFGTYEASDVEMGYADRDNDGEITVYDYILIKRTYFGTYFPENDGE